MEQLGLFGQWITPEGTIGGCTYSFACNFNPDAGVDDGSCEVESCAGCTWSDASNYDPEAVWDDGSCELTLESSCPEDINADGQVTTTDLLMFLAAYGIVCP